MAKGKQVDAPRSRARYTQEFKLTVVRYSLSLPESARIKPTCRAYPGIEPVQIRKWIRHFGPLVDRRAGPVMPMATSFPAATLTPTEVTEVHHDHNLPVQHAFPMATAFVAPAPINNGIISPPHLPVAPPVSRPPVAPAPPMIRPPFAGLAPASAPLSVLGAAPAPAAAPGALLGLAPAPAPSYGRLTGAPAPPLQMPSLSSMPSMEMGRHEGSGVMYAQGLSVAPTLSSALELRAAPPSLAARTLSASAPAVSSQGLARSSLGVAPSLASAPMATSPLLPPQLSPPALLAPRLTAAPQLSAPSLIAPPLGGAPHSTAPPLSSGLPISAVPPPTASHSSPPPLSAPALASSAHLASSAPLASALLPAAPMAAPPPLLPDADMTSGPIGLAALDKPWRLVEGQDADGPVYLDHRTDSVLSSISVGTMFDLLCTSVGA